MGKNVLFSRNKETGLLPCSVAFYIPASTVFCTQYMFYKYFLNNGQWFQMYKSDSSDWTSFLLEAGISFYLSSLCHRWKNLPLVYSNSRIFFLIQGVFKMLIWFLLFFGFFILLALRPLESSPGHCLWKLRLDGCSYHNRLIHFIMDLL